MICRKCGNDAKQMHYCLKCGNGVNLPPAPEPKVHTKSELEKLTAQHSVVMGVASAKYESLSQQHDKLMKDYAELNDELSKTVEELAKLKTAAPVAPPVAEPSAPVVQ